MARQKHFNMTSELQHVGNVQAIHLQYHQPPILQIQILAHKYIYIYTDCVHT